MQLQYLLVGEDEQQSVSELLLRQQLGQLAVSLHEAVSVAAVDHKHHGCEGGKNDTFEPSSDGNGPFLSHCSAEIRSLKIVN